MVANSSVTTTTETRVSRLTTRPAGIGSQSRANTMIACSTTLRNSDTISTKPMDSTTVSDIRRLFSSARMVLREGRGAMSQTLLRERCICANTVVAPTTMAPRPISVGRMPPWSIWLAATAVRTVSAASGPMVSCSWVMIRAMAASVLITRPITCTARITTGAIENRVKNASAPA